MPTTEVIRPRTLDDMIGQDDVRAQIREMLDGCTALKEQPSHCLFLGPAGTGKTTLANIIASATGGRIYTTAPSGLPNTKSLALILASLKDGDVLFIDEIHRLKKDVATMLYTAAEDFHIAVPSATRGTLPVDLNQFILVGATTDTGELSGPLLDRFGFKGYTSLYSEDELARIVTRAAGKIGVIVSDDAAMALAKRSRRTPRVALELLKRVRFSAAAKATDVNALVVDAIQMTEILDSYGIDSLGLTPADRNVLKVLCTSFVGRAIGVSPLASACGERVKTLQATIEPWLVALGMIKLLHHGRMATARAFEHLEIECPIWFDWV